MRRNHLQLLLFSLVAIASNSTVTASNNFTVINRSNEPVFIALHHRYRSSNNLSGDYQFGVDSESGWKTRGWYRIEPGQSKTVHTGSSEKFTFVLGKAVGR